MKGLASDVSNVLNRYKPIISINNRDVLAVSRATVERFITDKSNVKLYIANNIDEQDEANLWNAFCLAAIGVKEGIEERIVEGITKIVRRDITNPILRTTDNSNLKLVDQYQTHKLFTAITEGLEKPESTNTRRQFVNIAGIIFDWRETVMTNLERMAAMDAKSLGYGVRVHTNLCAVVILANKEWAAQQKWGAETSVAHH